MKLHEAIEKILETTGRAMSSKEIAAELNKKKLYQKKDGSPIQALQIQMRTRHYPELFVEDDENKKIYLKKWQLIDERYKLLMDTLLIENFKIFKGENAINLRQLNILTGANSSGKSTILKAISLFAKGLEKGDFPSINLFETKAGNFKDLVNRDTKTDQFSIGFYIPYGYKSNVLKVKYTFGDGSKAKYMHQNGQAVFSNFEVYDENGNFFLGTYIVSMFRVTKENIDYNHDWDKEPQPELPFKCAMDEGDEPMMFMKINIDLLAKLLPEMGHKKYTSLIEHVRKLHPSGNWWIPRFDIDSYFNTDFSEITIENLINDFGENVFLELLDIEKSKMIFYNDKLKEEERAEIEKEYNKIMKETEIDDFLENFFYPLLRRIEKRLDQYREGNYFHIVFQDFRERVVPYDPANRYLARIYQNNNMKNKMYRFTEEALKIFNIDGFARISAVENSDILIHLVHNISLTDKMVNKDKKVRPEWDFYFKNYDERYKNNPAENIADLGKGTAGLIGLILKTFSVLYEMERKSRKNYHSKRASKEQKTKLILIEEPEAFLHPNYQSKLADLLVFFTKKTEIYDVKLVVETHSVYLIQRLQYLVAKNEIEKDQIHIYYFNSKSDNENEKFYEMKLRDDGMFKNKFGTGFYDETAKLTLKLMKL